MLLAALSLAAAPALPLAPVFADHAVLQRDRPIAVWGSAPPGEAVTVRLGSDRVSTRADAAGAWHAKLPAHHAGGPYTLDVRTQSGAHRAVSDIMIGDVFLCSGQSNMEFPLAKSLGAEAEIAAADVAGVRLATIPPVSATLPLRALGAPLDWQPASPASAADFSAVCWYMAKALRREIAAPIGLIDASWGGSTIQAWMPPATLDTAGDRGAIDLLALYNRDPVAANLAWGGRWEQWWTDTVSAREQPWLDRGEAGWAPVPAMTLWEDWPDPVLADLNGMVWYRTRITLTPAQAAQVAMLDVGAIDEIDQSWVNGRPVGTGAGDAPRAYPIPAGTLNAGANIITVNILDTWDVGGPFGEDSRRAITFADGTRVPLDGGWQYRRVNFARPRPPRAPWYPAWGQGTLYNGMIAPLGNYGLRAVAWYQGESNASDGPGYGDRLRALMAGWRGIFGEATPMLIVQLANFGAVPEAPVESDWAAVREAQRRVAVADPHSGLAVTVDIGDPRDIHPVDKRSVGERLARAALSVVYGRTRYRVGPQPEVVVRQNKRVTIRFRDLRGRLAGSALGFELCGEAPGSCRGVEAIRTDDGVSIDTRLGDSRLRYCWGDSPRCSLRDAEVPLPPFETPLPPEPTR